MDDETARTVDSLRYALCALIRMHVYTRGLLYKAESVLAVATLPVGIVYVPLRCIWLG